MKTRVMFLCDRMKCESEGECKNTRCYHTNDSTHATSLLGKDPSDENILKFDVVRVGMDDPELGEIQLWEVQI